MGVFVVFVAVDGLLDLYLGAFSSDGQCGETHPPNQGIKVEKGICVGTVSADLGDYQSRVQLDLV